MRPPAPKVERKLARLARETHGVVTRAELLEAEITNAEIKTRIAAGSLIRIHRGVFRVGHAAPSLEARYLAAVRAGGDDALLGCRAAAHLLAILKGRPPRPEVLTGTRRRIRSVVTHLCPDAKIDATTWRGIPVTTVPRTLVDLAAVLEPPALGRAFHEAAVIHRTTPEQIENVLSRRHNWSGAGKLRRVIWGEEPVTLSRLESAFIAAVRRAGLPLPETNCVAGGRRVDCRWSVQRLTVELDSYRYHHSRHAWEQDRRREREARARGDEFRRYTYADVFEDPRFMLADLRGLLEGRKPRRS